MRSPESIAIENLLMIADKEGNDVPFTLNSAQRKLDESLTGRDLVPKARQEGVSSYFLARNLIKCLGIRNTHAVVISHDQESTQRMLKKVKYYINHIKGPPPVIENSSANMITFPKTDSMYYIGTAGSRKFGRGDTITDLHCSEYAFWSNPLELITGLFQAVPVGRGCISIESTGNGYNDYHRRCIRAASGDSRWACHFLPWHEFEEYTLFLTPSEVEDVMNSLSADMDEVNLSKVLTPGQIAWRRMKLEELDFDLRRFKQEYPMTLDECFQASGESIFYRVNFVLTDMWERFDNYGWILRGHPDINLHYSLGADAAAGVEKDYSVIEVICVETNEQVFEWRSNKIDPEAFGYKVADIGQMFNNAYTVAEANNHGVLTLSVLDKVYPRDKLHKTVINNKPKEEDKVILHELGYRTTARSKPLLIGRLRTSLAEEGGIRIFSSILRDELSTFIEDEGGKLGAQDGCHDDTVIALACANIGLNPAAIEAKNHRDRIWKRKQKGSIFTFENIIGELTSRGSRFAFSPQHRIDTFKN